MLKKQITNTFCLLESSIRSSFVDFVFECRDSAIHSRALLAYPLPFEQARMALAALFVFNAVDGISIGSEPTLDDDGGKGDGSNGEQGQGEEPPIDGCALDKRL